MLMPGGIPEAVSEFEAAVRLKPDNAEYHNNLGLALASTPGRLDDAMRAYETALRLDPHYQAAHLNLGLALMSAGRRDEAIKEYKIAIREYQRALEEKKLARDAEGDYWQAHLNLGIAYAQVPGYETDAITEFRSALRIKPEAAQAHFRLGTTFHKMGRLDDAISEYRASLKIEPDSTEVRYELAYALAQIPGRVPEAIAECREIFRINPNDGPAHELMASLLAFQSGQGR
jgi:tetratricopeptide (TPR) repeat protein